MVSYLVRVGPVLCDSVVLVLPENRCINNFTISPSIRLKTLSTKFVLFLQIEESNLFVFRKAVFLFTFKIRTLSQLLTDTIDSHGSLAIKYFYNDKRKKKH